MWVSIILLGLHIYSFSAETLDGTSTKFIKEYIEATNIKRIVIIKEQVGGLTTRKKFKGQ